MNKEITMKKLVSTSMVWMILGLCDGVFYRELTRIMNFSGKTVLKAMHPHLLMLGMFLFLILALFVKVLPGLGKEKSFHRFYWIWNAGLAFSMIMMLVRGIAQVMEVSLSKGMDYSISGMAGVGHILLAVGLVFLYMSFYRSLKEQNG